MVTLGRLQAGTVVGPITRAIFAETEVFHWSCDEPRCTTQRFLSFCRDRASKRDASLPAGRSPSKVRCSLMEICRNRMEPRIFTDASSRPSSLPHYLALPFAPFLLAGMASVTPVQRSLGYRDACYDYITSITSSIGSDERACAICKLLKAITCMEKAAPTDR